MEEIFYFVDNHTILWYIELNYAKNFAMRKADLVNQISEKTGIPKVDVLVTLEQMFKEIKDSLSKDENTSGALALLSPKKELLKLAETSKKMLLFIFLNT